MVKEELIQELEKKEALMQRTALIYQQLQGQVALLRELIKKEDSPKEEKKD
jgi:hypothetical protein